MSERPWSPPDLQETPPRLCQRQEAPAVLWSALASLQSSRWVPRVRLHILSPLHVSLGPNLPTYKRTPVLWTPTRPSGLTNSITSAKSSSPGQATSTGTGVRTSTHLAGDEREPNPRPGRDLTEPEGHTAVSVGAGLTAPGSTAALFRGLSRPYVQGLLPLPGTSRGGASRPSPASLQSASATPGGCWLPCPCYSVGASTAAGLSLPPPPPSCSGWSSGYQPERGGWGGAREGQSLRARHPPMRPARSGQADSLFRGLLAKTHQASCRRGLKEGKDFPLNTVIIKIL